MTEDLPIYRASVEHLLLEPRHRLRSENYPRRPSDLYPQENPVDQRQPQPIPSSLDVYDPTIGRDGGGRGVEQVPPPVDLDRYVTAEPAPTSAPLLHDATDGELVAEIARRLDRARD